MYDVCIYVYTKYDDDNDDDIDNETLIKSLYINKPI